MEVEIFGWCDIHISLSEVFKGTTYIVNKYCIATLLQNGCFIKNEIFQGECCDALAHNWGCGWFRFDEIPHINQIKWHLNY